MYIGNRENAPFCEMPEPEKRVLRILLSPELDPTQHDIACGLAEVPPGSNSDWRAHEEGELFFIISGEGKAKVGDEIVELRPFTAIYAPPNVPHQTFVAPDAKENLVMLFVLTPPFGGDKRIIERWRTAKNNSAC